MAEKEDGEQTVGLDKQPSAGPAQHDAPEAAQYLAPARSAGATVSLPLSSVLLGAVATLFLVLAAVFGFLWLSAKSDLDDKNAQAADDRHAEQIATDYAVGAATVNYQDINAWVAKLKADTTPQLANKFDATAPKLEQILVPLKWTSTATPITAKVISDDNGVYKVNVFVNVSSTNAQSPEGAQTTVTYNVTLDQKSDWKITDVGGVDGALPLK
ncbi:hypothetical protein [Nocardia goodfellowii]|uniref:Mce-associated membrane protein n=1 Tax=Nocardia goodfellowii TaxID=882446 RepID=A0ABS4Q7E5_9NOCA|nr:hypothetical protein [Nocardia goodfellowii]MBP2187612.1 Mce-associated membrane protein [Nocardia goodfellowii]